MEHHLFIDTETTGVNPDNNEVIEVAAILYTDGKKINSFNSFLDFSSSAEISLGALRVNRRKLIDSGLTNRTKAIKLFADFLVSLPNDRQNPVIVGGHNTHFDVNFLKKMLEEERLTGWGDLFAYSVIDTSTIGNFLRSAGYITFDRMSLANLAQALNITVDKNKTHGAYYDAELSALCYYKMKSMLNENFNNNRSSFSNIKLNNT